MFGIKGVFNNEALTRGLVIKDNKESVDDKAIVECDGFIQHDALLQKDFACSLVSSEVDNIDYIPPTEMPICPAGSEIDYDDPGYPWTAPEPSEEVTENSDDYIISSKLRFATGTITSMDPGETKYVSVLGNYGPCFWSIDVGNLTNGSITHVLTSGLNYGNKAKYKASDNASGSFSISVHDSFRTISRTISIGTNDWWIYRISDGKWHSVYNLSQGIISGVSLSNLSVQTNLTPYTPTVEITNELEPFGEYQYDAYFNSIIEITSNSTITQIGSQSRPNGIYAGTELSKTNTKFVISILNEYTTDTGVSTGTYTYNNFYVKYPDIDLITIASNWVYNIGTESSSGSQILCVSYTSETNYIQIKSNYESGSVVSYTYSGKINNEEFTHTVLSSLFIPTTIYMFAPKFGKEA